MEAYDFSIGTLKFRCATSKDTPYARSTAPFRKDQFDSSPTVGDQSLTGWWTRGQLSFHKGGGVNYYEVLDGETVLNRSQYTDGVEVATPGQVTLHRDLSSFTLPGDVTRTVMAGSSLIGISGGVVKKLDYASNNPPYPTASTATVTQATAGGYGSAITTGFPGTFYSNTLINQPAHIEKVSSGSTTGSVLWTHHVVNSDWSGLWWVKNRILAQDSTGNLMLLSGTTGGTTTTSDIFATLNIRNMLENVVDTPGPIIGSAGSRLYAISVDSSTAVPTPSLPVQVAELPSDEHIIGLAYQLGYLVIITEKGVRLGVLSGTNLTYGPQFLTAPRGSTKQIVSAVRGSSVMFCARGPAGLGLYEINLSETVSDLVPAWSCRWLHPSPQNGTQNADYSAGAWVGSNGLIVFCDEWGTVGTTAYSSVPSIPYYANPPLLTSGHVLTGYHRFGTLDPKRFYSVRVRCSGGGTIMVSQVFPPELGLADAVLGTVTASTGGSSLACAEPSTLERLALKFTLKSDPTTPTSGPTLLGYQIKALPAPSRQRIVKVPLVIQDRVRLKGGTDTGRAGRAWSDLQALEALESSQAIVTFTDHRTGETGSAYIDSVDFQGMTPTSDQSNGFGGVAYVQLRKVT